MNAFYEIAFALQASGNENAIDEILQIAPKVNHSQRSHILLGVIVTLIKLGNKDRAIIDRVIEISHGLPEGEKYTCMDFKYIIEALLDLEDCGEAHKFAYRIPVESWERDIGLQKITITLVKQGNPYKAIEIVNTISPGAWVFTGALLETIFHALIELKGIDDAIEELTANIFEEEIINSAFCVMIAFLMRTGDIEKALNIVNRINPDAKGGSKPLFEFMRASIRLKGMENTIELATHAISNDKLKMMAFDEIPIALISLDRTDEALQFVNAVSDPEQKKQMIIKMMAWFYHSSELIFKVVNGFSGIERDLALYVSCNEFLRYDNTEEATRVANMLCDKGNREFALDQIAVFLKKRNGQ